MPACMRHAWERELAHVGNLDHCRQAVEARVGNLEAELRAREATLSSRLSEQLHQERGASEARCLAGLAN